ncbi:parallel beta-helix repeat protein [Flavobacterium sp. 28YEA47A]|uniref:T9SS type A sorting domain-containing protein n=1 Tax=Flavobacterium sp. 28YEA47A TaxID=3156276 RepID=UPI003513348F
MKKNILFCTVFLASFLGFARSPLPPTSPVVDEKFETTDVTPSNSTELTVIYLSDYATLESAIDFLNASTTFHTLVIDKSVTLVSDKTVSEKKALKFLKGNIITIPNSKTLFINSSIDAGIYQIFNCLGTGKTDGFPQIDQTYPQWWQTYDENPQADWSDSIQRAINFYPKVYFPARVQNSTSYSVGYPVFKTVYLDLNKRNLNHDRTSYHLYSSGGIHLETAGSSPEFTGFVFKCINIPQYGFDKAIIFENLIFYCTNGLEFVGGSINNTPPYNAVDNFGDEYYAITKVKIINCNFIGKTTAAGNNDTGIALSFKKAYDCEVANNKIENFNIGIKLEGSDLNTISNNRFIGFWKYAILDLSRIHDPQGVNFQIGSQNLIFHNDILDYRGPSGAGAFIKSNSHHVIIRDNFLENNPFLGPDNIRAFIDCTNVDLTNLNVPLVMDITGNRLSKGGQYSYLINEDFKSLNLIEAPLALGIDEVPKSSFALNSNSFTPTRDIPITFSGRPKNINFGNAFSFWEWQSFKTSNIIENSFDGSMIINPSNISDLGETFSNASKFNPKSIKLKAGTSNYSVIQISQKITGESNDTNLLPKNLKIKIVTRNGRASDVEDFYFKIQKGKHANTDDWKGRGRYLSTNTSNTNYNNFNIYEIVPDISFDSNSDYYMTIDAKYDSEIKSIIIEPIINTIMLHDASVAEGGLLVFPITLSNPLPNDVTLTFAYTNISAATNDYTVLASKTITAGTTSDVVKIQTINDTTIESDETFKLGIASATNFTGDISDTAIGTILNNDFSLKSAENDTVKDIIKTEELYKINIDSEIKVYPNPVKDILNFEIKRTDSLTNVEIYDETGKFIDDLTKKINNNSVDISSLPNGSYIVKIITINNQSEIIIKK